MTQGSAAWCLTLDIDPQIEAQMFVGAVTFETIAAGVHMTFFPVPIRFDIVVDSIFHGCTSYLYLISGFLYCLAINLRTTTIFAIGDYWGKIDR